MSDGIRKSQTVSASTDDSPNVNSEESESPRTSTHLHGSLSIQRIELESEPDNSRLHMVASALSKKSKMKYDDLQAVSNMTVSCSKFENVNVAASKADMPSKDSSTTSKKVKYDELQVLSDMTVNFYMNISETNPRIKKTTRMKNRLVRMFRLRSTMSQNEFNETAKKLYNCSLKHIKDIHELHKRRLLALDYLNDIINRADIKYIDVTQVVHLIWSIMSCIHHFQLRFRSGTFSIVTWTRRRKAEECLETYVKLISKFSKSMHRTILNAIIVFYKEGKLWEIEFACTDLVCKLMYLYDDVEEAVEDILMTAELSSISNENEAVQLIQVLYEVLEKIKWSHMSEPMLRRFLKMLRMSILPKPEQAYNYAPMRRGLNICLRNITRNLNNKDLLMLLVIIVKKIKNREEMEDEALLEFGSIVEFAALRYTTDRYETSLPDDVVCNLLSMIKSASPLHNLLGTRVFQNLIDRHNNRNNFNTPKVYFQNCKYNITVNTFSARDKNYFRKYREQIHLVIMEALRCHYHNKVNLENLFATLAVLLVEIPCGYTASSVVCIAMAIQEFTLNKKDIDMIPSHHLHATVMSIMSLVCYIHKAEVFYNYFNTILERRSRFAPHLNPPIKAVYDYAQHFILWNKPDLFFEDWEARYGLWKCFRTVQMTTKDSLHKIRKKNYAPSQRKLSK